MGKNRFYLKLLWILLFLMPILTGCGEKEDDLRQLGIDGHVYVAQQVGLQGMRLKTFRTGDDGYLYYCSGDYAQGTDFRRFPIDEFLSQESPELPAGESLFAVGSQPDYIQDFTVDAEGCLYYLEERRDIRDVPLLRPLEEMDGYTVDETERSYVLVKLFSDGTEGYCVSLAGYGRSLAQGEAGNIYVQTDDYIYVVNRDGRMLDRIALEEETGRLLEGEGGRAYFDTDESRGEVFELAGEGVAGSFYLKKLKGPDLGGGTFAGSRRGLMYSSADGLLWCYEGDKASWEVLLRWGDSCLSVRWNWELLYLSEDRMMVCLPVSGQTDSLQAYLLTRTPVEELPEKEVMVMVSCNLYGELEQYVMEFNRSSGQYHITIRYIDEAKLDAVLVSSEPPDLIDMTDLDYIKYGQKDVLEDLEPYLEESGLLGKEDFPEVVLQACTVKGNLVCIPDEICCNTVIGRASQVGTEAGWTAADAMALTESFSQASLFKNNSFSAMVREFFRDYILEQYVDWEKGECYFDSEEFLDFIRWVAEHSDGTDNDELPIEALVGTMPEERLLSIRTDIMAMEDLLYQRAYFGEEVTAVGYPTVDGSVSHHGRVFHPLGIVASSGRKEGAWQFIEFFLARENGSYTFLPARRDRLERLAQELAAEEGGESGIRKIHIWIPDGMEEYRAGMTREELDAVYMVLDNADYTPMYGTRKKLIDIIVEEMSPCLADAKSYENAAAIVQDRVSILIQEGM